MKKLSISLAICLCCAVQIIAQNSASSMLVSMNPNQSHDYFEKPTSFSSAFDVDEEGEFDDYGGKLSIGIALGDGFGVPVRYYISPKMVAEAGLYAASNEVSGIDIQDADDFEDLKIETATMIGLGFIYFGDRFLKEKRRRNKVRAHGVALRLNRMTGDWGYTTGSLGWAMETFKENRTGRSFIFELGLRGIAHSFDVYQNGNTTKNGVNGYIRLHWNFFID